MADQKGDRTNDRSASSGGNAPKDPKKTGMSDPAGEPDDVAEDRNLSGASTWLTLPDQQPPDEDEVNEGGSGGEAGSKSSKDKQDRQTNR